MSKTKGCAAGILLGSILKALFVFLGWLAKAIATVLWYTGLWVPGVYALFGGVLYLVWHFDPLSGGLYPTLYLVGFGLCVLIFLIVFVRNLFVKPFKSVAEGFRNPVWEREKGEENDDKRAKDDDDEVWRKTKLEHRRKQALERSRKSAKRTTENHIGSAEEDDTNKNEGSGDSKATYGRRKHDNAEEKRDSDETEKSGEEPKIYLSAVEKNTLIHEFGDRFEVYDLDGGKKSLRTVEYKGDRR